jgi:hypothetical protein
VAVDSQVVSAALTLAGTIIAAFLAAFLGAVLALRRHRSEQWFDRKMETYAAIFDAMNELSEEIDQLLDEEMRPNFVVTPEHRTALATASAKARRHLRKASRIGSFTISPEAEAILVRMLKQLDLAVNEQTYFQHLDRNGAAIDAAIAELKIAARQDLNN